MRSRSRLRHYSEPFIRTSEVAIVYWCATGLEVISGIRLAAAHVHRNGCPRGAEILLSGIGIPTRRITAKRDCVPHPLNSLSASSQASATSRRPCDALSPRFKVADPTEQQRRFVCRKISTIQPQPHKRNREPR
jgi:hypothetical protein